VAGVCFGLDLVFWHASIGLTSVANATLFANLTPVFVVAAAWLLYRERPRARFAAGVVVAMAGAAALAGPNLAAMDSGQRWLGDLLGVITSIWYAGYLLAIERARHAAGGATVALVITVVAAAVAALAMLVTGESPWPESMRGWLVLLALALLVHVAGQGGIIWALGELRAALGAVVILVQPVVAAALGWMLLGESPGWMDGVGAALILAGILACRRG
jgi:drug/metabolite transporter (DMT)-like permease